MIRHIVATVVGTAALSALACGGQRASQDLKEIQRTRSGNIDVVLLAADGVVNQGKDSLVVEFRSASGGLVDVGTIKATASMPMAGMAPMLGSIEARGADAPGRYTLATELSMAGDWRLGFEWTGPAGHGSATLSTAAQ